MVMSKTRSRTSTTTSARCASEDVAGDIAAPVSHDDACSSPFRPHRDATLSTHRAFAPRQRDERNNNASPSPGAPPPSSPSPFQVVVTIGGFPELDGRSARGSPPRGHDRRPLRHHRRLPHRRGTLDHFENSTRRAEAHPASVRVYAALGGDVYAAARRDDTVRVAFEEGQTVRLVHGEAVFETTDVPRRRRPSARVSLRHARETLSASILPSRRGDRHSRWCP